MYKITTKFGKDDNGNITLAEHKYVHMYTGEVIAELVGDETVWYKNMEDKAQDEFMKAIFEAARHDIMQDEYLSLIGVKPKCKLPQPVADLEAWLNTKQEVSYDF
jgi:hypothetical protein